MKKKRQTNGLKHVRPIRPASYARTLTHQRWHLALRQLRHRSDRDLQRRNVVRGHIVLAAPFIVVVDDVLPDVIIRARIFDVRLSPSVVHHKHQHQYCSDGRGGRRKKKTPGERQPDAHEGYTEFSTGFNFGALKMEKDTACLSASLCSCFSLFSLANVCARCVPACTALCWLDKILPAQNRPAKRSKVQAHFRSIRIHPSPL